MRLLIALLIFVFSIPPLDAETTVTVAGKTYIIPHPEDWEIVEDQGKTPRPNFTVLATVRNCEVRDEMLIFILEEPNKTVTRDTFNEKRIADRHRLKPRMSFADLAGLSEEDLAAMPEKSYFLGFFADTANRLATSSLYLNSDIDIGFTVEIYLRGHVYSISLFLPYHRDLDIESLQQFVLDLAEDFHRLNSDYDQRHRPPHRSGQRNSSSLTSDDGLSPSPTPPTSDTRAPRRTGRARR